ncbi:MAG: glycosyltransferase family 2 protein [Deltaproteobacteria bacterium]|nr:glycosyltransferase family 2 protein [Deltaproteobacteria bacterium]
MRAEKNTCLPADDKKRLAAVIPVFNHGTTVSGVVLETLKLCVPVIVVDDGSTDSTPGELQKIEGITLLRHSVNRGKGAAILTGMACAANSANWIITIDADGQHDPLDAKKLIQAIPKTKRPIIVGNRKGMLEAQAPWTSRFGREFSNFWVRISGGPRIADSQSGFRIYPFPESLDLDVKARRFQFEIEILVKANLARIPVLEVPVSVTYNPNTKRISHFHPFFDFLRNFGTFTRLIFYRVTGIRV